jgi:hypothetical protein
VVVDLQVELLLVNNLVAQERLIKVLLEVQVDCMFQIITAEAAVVQEQLEEMEFLEVQVEMAV